jgi:hypothetical protein
MNQENMDTCLSRLFLRVTRRPTKHTSLVQITGRKSVDDYDYDRLRVTRRTTKHTSLVQITGRESVDYDRLEGSDDDCLIYYDPGENATPVPRGKPL